MKADTGRSPNTAVRPSVTGESPARKEPQRPAELAAEVARVLAAMSCEERVRAYRSRAFSAHELAVAAAWFGDEMPRLNGELEWIAIDLE